MVICNAALKWRSTDTIDTRHTSAGAITKNFTRYRRKGTTSMVVLGSPHIMLQDLNTFWGTSDLESPPTGMEHLDLDTVHKQPKKGSVFATDCRSK
jgi:hypothetical protein